MIHSTTYDLDAAEDSAANLRATERATAVHAARDLDDHQAPRGWDGAWPPDRSEVADQA